MTTNQRIAYIAHCSPHEYVHQDMREYLRRFPDVDLWSAADFTDSLPPFPTSVSQVNPEMMMRFAGVYDQPFVEAMREAERRGYGAVATPSYGDPGIRAAQGVISIPCVGMAWAGYSTAAALGPRFSVLHNHLPELMDYTVRQIEAYGFGEHLVSVEHLNVDVYDWLANARKPDSAELLPLAIPLVERAAGKGAKVLLIACGSPELSEFASFLNAWAMNEAGVAVLPSIDTVVGAARNLMRGSEARQ